MRYARPCTLGHASRLAFVQALTPSLWYCCSSAPNIPAPASFATNPLQQSAHDGMSCDLFPHRLLFGRHGSTWPGDDHATSRGLSRRFPSLLLLHNQPLPFNAPRVPAIILLPWGFSCCCKLPAHDHAPVVGLLVFSIAHGYTPAERLELLLLRLLLPCPRPVLTAPTVILLPIVRLPHMFPPAKLVPAWPSVGGNTLPPCSSCHCQSVPKMVWHSIPAAPGVGCVRLPPNSLPTIMLPS